MLDLLAFVVWLTMTPIVVQPEADSVAASRVLLAYAQADVRAESLEIRAEMFPSRGGVLCGATLVPDRDVTVYVGGECAQFAAATLWHELGHVQDVLDDGALNGSIMGGMDVERAADVWALWTAPPQYRPGIVALLRRRGTL